MHVALLLRKENGREKKEKKRGGEGVMLCGQVSVMMMALPLLQPWFRRPPWRWSGWFHSVDGVLFRACSLDGLWLIHDNYLSSIPVFYNVLDTVRIFLGYDKINSVRSDFLEYPIQYKKVGYC